MKLLILSSAIATTAGFAPSTNTAAHFRSALSATTEPEIEAEVPEVLMPIPELSAASAETPISINGWTPNESYECFGLPGAVAPTGFFDPIGFSRYGITLNEVKRYREAEVMHGRVAMLATVGYLAGESFSGPFNIVGPANDQLQQMPLPAFIFLTVAIAAAELKRATIGWVEPDLKSWTKTLWTLRDNYYPGDVGFDPLNFKPTNAAAFADMQTRELQNGRLAMLGVAGMCAQELVNHRTIFETFDFYSKVYSGINPYESCGEGYIC